MHGAPFILDRACSLIGIRCNIRDKAWLIIANQWGLVIVLTSKFFLYLFIFQFSVGCLDQLKGRANFETIKWTSVSSADLTSPMIRYACLFSFRCMAVLPKQANWNWLEHVICDSLGRRKHVGRARSGLHHFRIPDNHKFYINREHKVFAKDRPKAMIPGSSSDFWLLNTNVAEKACWAEIIPSVNMIRSSSKLFMYCLMSI